MAVTAFPFLTTLADAFQGKHDWANDTIKAALIDDTLAPDQNTHDTWSDLSANEITGTGYDPGGTTLGNCAVVSDDANDRVELQADNATWAGATFTARYAVIYNDTDANDAIMGYVDFDGNQEPVGETFSIQWTDGTVFRWPVNPVV